MQTFNPYWNNAQIHQSQVSQDPQAPQVQQNFQLWYPLIHNKYGHLHTHKIALGNQIGGIQTLGISNKFNIYPLK